MRQAVSRLAAVLLIVAATGALGLNAAAQPSGTSGQVPTTISAAPTGKAGGAAGSSSQAIPAGPTGAGAAAAKAAAGGSAGAGAPAVTAPDIMRNQPGQGASATGNHRVGGTAARPHRPGLARRLARSLRWLRSWLWTLGAGADKTRLPRATITAIALIAAFLTVVQIWQIPPPNTTLASTAPTAAASAPAAAAGTKTKNGTAADKSQGPFDSNFAHTVFAGLGGMFVVTFLDSLWANKDFDGKAYYLVLFVGFFLMILFVSAFLRACGEALRSRVAMPYRRPVKQAPPQEEAKQPPHQDGQPPAAHGQPPGGDEQVPKKHRQSPRKDAQASRAAKWARLRVSLSYGARGLWGWLLSWRKTLLVFWDTAFSVIQGQNQLRTFVFESSIIDLQWSLAHAAREICGDVHRTVIEALRSHYAAEEIEYSDIRVNISTLADDGKSVFYVAWEPGSLFYAFPQHSLAWVTVYFGQARWWKHEEWDEYVKPAYQVYGDDVPLIKDSSGLPVDDHPVTIGKYFQVRPPIDYEAFMMLPIPWNRRGSRGDYRKAGLHISFRRKKHLVALWSNLEVTEESGHCTPNYEQWESLLKRPRRGSQTGNGGAPAPAAPPAAEPPQPVAPHAQPATPPIQARNPTLPAVLEQALGVMAEVLCKFDQQVFQDYILPGIDK